MRNKPRRTFFSKGVIFSVFLHLILIGFIVFWGVGKQGEKPSGPIEVSLSTGDFGGGGPGGSVNTKPIKKTEKKIEKKKEVVKKKEPAKKKEDIVKKEEPVKKEVKQEIKEPEKKIVEEKAKEIPEKKVVEKKEEPKEEEIKKKEVVIPEKKVEEKKEIVKKEEPEKKEEVVKKEEPPKKEEPVKEAEKVEEKEPEEKIVKKAEETVSSRDDVLKEMKRNAVLKKLKEGSGGKTTEVAKNNTNTEGNGDGGGLEGKGGSGGGGNSRINPVVLSNYYDVLSKRVDRVLVFPPNVELDGSYEAQVRFWMNENGRVYGVAVHKTSGNNIIDNNCVKAVNSAAPFPSPPDAIQSRIKVEPFVIPCSNKG